MTDPTPDPPRSEPGSEPPRIPGERRLAHPPSDRYRQADPAPMIEDPAASPARGVAFGIVAAIAGAAAITLLGGLLAVSSGLLVAAGATGWAVGIALRAGTAGRLAAGRQAQLAVALAVLSVGLGQLGLWAYARTEGGVLDPVGYLAEVFGWLVPLELLAAAVVAWATAR